MICATASNDRKLGFSYERTYIHIYISPVSIFISFDLDVVSFRYYCSFYFCNFLVTVYIFFISYMIIASPGEPRVVERKIFHSITFGSSCNMFVPYL